MRGFEIFESPYDYLRQLTWNDHLAVAISLERVKNEQLISRLNLHCLSSPNNIHEYPLKILASKEYPFLTELNQFIQMAIENGLIVKWLKGIRLTPSSEKTSLYEYSGVSFESLVILIAIWCCIHLFNCFIAVVEKIAYEKVHVEKVQSFWRYVEMSINPDRYFLIGNKRACYS